MIWVLSDERYLAQRMPRALIDQLHAMGERVRLVVAERALTQLGTHASRPAAWQGLRPGDLVVVRTRHRFGLALLRAAEAAGGRTCPNWAAISAVRNKLWAFHELARYGIPIPPTFIAADPQRLGRLDRSCFPLLLKPHLGDNGRGIVLVSSPEELQDIDWRDGVTLAQTYVEHRGVDLKLYVIGDDVEAIRRPSPLGPGRGEMQRVQPTTQLRDLALRVRDLFGLQLLGIDVLETDGGPLVVDVNDFPNYTGVEKAPAAIAGKLLAEAQ